MLYRTKRILALVLSFLMLLGLLPVTPVMALGEPEVIFGDGDGDHAYFAGDILGFNMTNLPVELNEQTVRVAFGIVSDAGTFSTQPVIGGLSNDEGSGTLNYAEADVSGGAFTANLSGIIQSGLPLGVIGCRIYVNMGAWTNVLAGQPQDFIVLSADAKPAFVGVTLPVDVTSDPVLGAGTQNAENLYNMNISFQKTIAAGITGKMAFSNLNLVSARNQLTNLAAMLTMQKEADPGAGNLEKYTLGVDVGVMTFLANIGAAVSVTSASFDGCETADFAAVSADVAGGEVSGLAFDDATDTISFNVNHFSNYSLTLKAAESVTFSTSKTDVTTEGGSDGSITVISPSGGGGTYEYSYDNGGTWVSEATKTGLTAGTYQVKARDAANTVNESAAQEVAIAQPVAPAAPGVTNDDIANTVSGMAEGMEYELDGAGFVAYSAAGFSAINFSGAHVLVVRIAAAGINPAGATTTLIFTINPPELGNNYEIGTGTNIDAAADGNGNVYAVYENGGNIYLAKNRQTPEAIPGGGSDSVASIAVQANGTVHVVFVRSGSVTYARRELSGSWAVTTVSSGSSPDIAVDSDGHAHLIYLMNPGDYDDVMYSNNLSGSFAATLIYDGYYWYDGGGRSANYFSNPSINVDSNGKYHISAVIHVINGGMGWTDHNYTICYTTNSGTAGSDAGYFGNNSSVTQNRRSLAMKNDVPAPVYSTGTGIYCYPSSLLVSGASAPAAAAYGARMGIAYNSSGVKYIFDTGSSFSGTANIDAAGTNPAVAVDGTYSFVFYEKASKVYLTTDKNVPPPFAASITDTDLDNVYFEGDTLSFNLTGLDSLDGQTVRVAFGTVSDGGVFTSASVVGGLTASSDGVLSFTTKTVAGATFASDVSGTIQSGLGLGVTAVQVYYESEPGTWTNAFESMPQPFLVLGNGPHPAYTGIALPAGVISTPALGAGEQDIEDLYNIDIAFAKTIDNDVTGKLSFEGLNLISNKGQLASLAGAIAMQKEVDPGAGNLEKYTLGVDVGAMTFLANIGAAVSVTSDSFDGCETADFAAVSADVAGGEVSGLAFDDATDTVSFNVNHFSNYSLTLVDPADTNADGYYDADVAVIRAFLELPSASAGLKNGEVVLDVGYNGEEPSTYITRAFFTWNSEMPKRLTGIRWDMNYGYHSGDLAGTFDASALTELTSLTIEGTDENGVTAITVAGLTKLVTLHVRENAMTTLDVSGCTALTDLDCQENFLTALTLTGASELTDLNCGYNQLSSLNLNGLTKLEKIWVYYNSLTSLDLSPFAVLTSLDCQGNDLTSLNLVSNPLLTEIYCGENNLGTLNVSGKTQLTSLGCNTCGLTDMNVSGCTALSYIYCSDNNLISLNLSGLTALTDLYCNGNKLSFSDLPAELPAAGGTYVYAPQQTIPVTLTSGNVIDLSAEEVFGGNHTLYTWYKSSDNSVITNGISVPNDGVFVFDRAAYAGTGVYCTMSNASFPSFVGGDALKTVPATILNLPQLSAPVPTVSGTAVSWSAVTNAASYLVSISQGGSDVCSPISTASLSINLALLPGESWQTLASGTYDVAVKAVANPATHLDSDYSLPASSVAVTLKNALEQVNSAADAAAMKTALETNKAALGISNSVTGTVADNEYADLTAVGKTAAAAAMSAGQPYANNTAVAVAFAAAVKQGVLADETEKYENTVTLAYDPARGDGADVESLIRILKSGQTANGNVSITNRALISFAPNPADAGGEMIAADASSVTAPKPNWTGVNRMAYITFTLSFGGETKTYTVAITIEPVPASVVMKLMNEAADAGDAESVLNLRDNRINAGIDSSYVNYWDDQNAATNDFTDMEKRFIAISVWNSGANYQMNSTGMAALTEYYQNACMQVFINRAKAIIGSSFTAVEGVDSNLLTSLTNKTGMSATEVTIALTGKSPAETMPVTIPSGVITYNSSSHFGTVTLSLTFDTESTPYTIEINILQEDTTAPDASGSATITTASVAQTSLILNWTAATDDVTDSSELMYFVIQSSTNNIDTLSNCEANGTPVTESWISSTTLQITGLSPGTKYYFNVAARDNAGNHTAYTMLEVTTASGGGGDGGAVADNKGQEVVVNTTDGSVGVEGILTVAGNTNLVSVDGSLFDKLANTNQGAVIPAGAAIVTFDQKAIDTISDVSGTGDVVLSVEKIDLSTLSLEMQMRVGDRPVYDFTVSKNGVKISDFNGGTAEVSVPYTLKSGESPNKVVIYYLADDGSLKTIRGHYDPVSKTVIFKTSHFSKYVVGYNSISFADVASDSWYKEAVDFIAARGITTGTDGNNFSPDAILSRGQFIVMLMRAYEIEPTVNPIDNFSDAGGVYYTNYLAAAKSLGIVSGIGGNLFAPEQKITRQEMFVMLYNALKVLGELPDITATETLSDFKDADQVDSWAQEAVNAMICGGVISGYDGMISPVATSTRAQMAQVMYNILSK